MPSKPAVDPEDMYQMWLSCSRNQAEAARRLGVNPATLGYHARQHNFDGRYAADFSGAASSAVKMAIVDKQQKYGQYLNRLEQIILDGTDRDAISAFKEMREAIKFDPQNGESSNMSFLEARGVVQARKPVLEAVLEAPVDSVGSGAIESPGDEALSLEALIREQLEANIIDAVEQRSLRGGGNRSL